MTSQRRQSVTEVGGPAPIYWRSEADRGHDRCFSEQDLTCFDDRVTGDRMGASESQRLTAPASSQAQANYTVDVHGEAAAQKYGLPEPWSKPGPSGRPLAVHGTQSKRHWRMQIQIIPKCPSICESD